MKHTLDEKQWGETVLVDYNEGLHKRDFRDTFHDCTHANM